MGMNARPPPPPSDQIALTSWTSTAVVRIRAISIIHPLLPSLFLPTPVQLPPLPPNPPLQNVLPPPSDVCPSRQLCQSLLHLHLGLFPLFPPSRTLVSRMFLAISCRPRLPRQSNRPVNSFARPPSSFSTNSRTTSCSAAAPHASSITHPSCFTSRQPTPSLS